MTTTRQVTATGLGSKAAIEWSDTDRWKKGLEPAKTEVKAIRERWAALTNEHLLERGIEVRVDHRSLQEQGVDWEPQSHLGPSVSGMERRGMETEVGNRIRGRCRPRPRLGLSGRRKSASLRGSASSCSSRPWICPAI